MPDPIDQLDFIKNLTPDLDALRKAILTKCGTERLYRIRINPLFNETNPLLILDQGFYVDNCPRSRLINRDCYIKHIISICDPLNFFDICLPE